MKAIVIGNATVDETYAVARAPRTGESLIGEFRLRDVGGKGANVAAIMARCGLMVQLVAAIGDDERAHFLRKRLAAEPLVPNLLTLPLSATDLSLIFSTDTGDNAIVTTVATTQAMPAAHALDSLSDAAPGDLVVLQGNLPAATSLAIIHAARERELVVALNPSPLVAWLQEAIPLVDSIFLNDIEAEALVGERAEQAVDSLLRRGVREVVLTRGAAGALFGAADGNGVFSLISVSAEKARVVDTTGAGDTFMAVALASAALRDGELDARALHHAARAAAVTIGRVGTLSAFPDAVTLATLLAGE